ncbi:uncharacterized protein [Palaemon carinicauda]|uniref:uncharacterized protein isoform X1 n=1 Tax=Palaemon carinicauda TaxID=392227 RepID=UPI0035B588A7
MKALLYARCLFLLLSVNKGIGETVKVFGMQTDNWAIPTADVVIRYNLSQRIPPDENGEYTAFSVCYWAKPTTLMQYETHVSLATASQKNDVLHLYRRGEQHGFYYNGVRQFGFITNLTSPVGLNEWTHYCHIFNEGIYEGYVNGEKKAIGKVDSEEAISFRGIITFGQEQDVLGGGYEVNQCFRGYFSQFNIWNKVITEGEIIQQATCQQLVLGDIFSLDRENIEVLGATMKEVNIKELCKHEVEYVIFPETHDIDDSKLTCKRVGYHVYSPISVAENKILHKQSMQFAKECNSNYHLWIGITDEQSEGEWLKFTDNTIVKDPPFELYEPNGGDGENCVLMSLPSGLWVDTSCEIEWQACVPCEVDRTTPLRLRGFCFDNEAETFYEVHGYEGGKPLIHGYYGYMIFKTSEGEWRMHDTTVNETVATLSAPSEDFYPIGLRLWKLERSMCKYISGSFIHLSLTICDNTQFGCSNGDCIPKEKRCNGNNDCSDFSDESNCTLVTLPSGYRAERHPDNETEGEALHLTAAIYILRFVEIDSLKQTIKLEITVEIIWRDSRLSYLNLDSMSDVNKLSEEEILEIWAPDVRFPNAYKGKTEILEEEIKVEKLATPLDQNFNNVMMDYVYSGDSASLIQRKHHSGRFICNFDVFYYPFDVQKCLVLVQLASVKKDLVAFDKNTVSIHYNDTRSFAEYFLGSFEIFVIETGMKDSYSTLQIQLELRRRWTVIVLNVFLPTSMLQIIGYSTLFIDFATLDVRLAVSLTTLLVLYTLFNNTSDSLPVTAYVKMIDIWFFFCIFLLFSTTVIHVIVECLRRKNAITVVHPLYKKPKPKQLAKLSSLTYNFLSIIRVIIIPTVVILFNLIYWSTLILKNN